MYFELILAKLRIFEILTSSSIWTIEKAQNIDVLKYARKILNFGQILLKFWYTKRPYLLSNFHFCDILEKCLGEPSLKAKVVTFK